MRPKNVVFLTNQQTLRPDAVPCESGAPAQLEVLTRQLHVIRAREEMFRDALERIYQGACKVSANRDHPVRPDPYLWIQATGASALSTLVSADHLGPENVA